MNLNENLDLEDDLPKNIVSLGNDEIKSILKTQSEATFQDKNLTNNSNFIKKSLIDIALDFKSKESNNENLETKENIKEEGTEHKKTENTVSKSNEDANQIEKTVEFNSSNEIDEVEKLSDQSSSKPELVNPNNDELNTDSNELNSENNQSEKLTKMNTEADIENVNSENVDQSDKNEIILEPNTNIDETQQALESVRDAVSQSLNKSDNENDKISNESKDTPNDISEIISKDFDEFKNIFSSLSNLGEKAIYEAVQSKIIDIAYDLAGYQIDKMPEKYEKKIMSLLKNINCFQDKMKIEVNDQDYDALSKIENFFDSQDKSIFVSNQDLSRGDIILNCDGMHYSEKSNKT
ncbi:MAG: FliH/SctL family protein [Candidatus Puniceispirillales bacterium]